MTCRLLKIEIAWDTNEYGERACLVTPTYLRDGKVMTVPDTKGWPTRAQAIAEAERKINRRIPSGGGRVFFEAELGLPKGAKA